MKIITFVVPCYNSEAYMEHCLETLLPLGDDTEIILVNDGSSDKTPEICDDYANRYPDLVRVVHQENGGHGEGVNVGISNARGLYLKVVDSDDWLDVDAAKAMLNKLRELVKNNAGVDMFICNYVYEHSLDNTSRVIRYTNVLPQDKVFSWKDVKRFRVSQYLLMHSIIYRTELLQKSGIKLPKHTFYVDNIYAYSPMPDVKSIYYMNLDLYRYFIGRADQSVNESIMVKRVSQQIRITKIMLDAHDLDKVRAEQPRLAKYMSNYLNMMVSICSILLLLDDRLDEFEELWRELKRDYPSYYKTAKRSPFAFIKYFKGKLGRKFTLIIYKTARNIYHFN